MNQVQYKYGKGDWVFVIRQGVIHRARVSKIKISVNGSTDIKYHVIFETVDLGPGTYPESLLFKTKEALKASL